jgi:hypothetical protein
MRYEQVQVFLIGDSGPEVSGRLKRIESSREMLDVSIEEDGQVYRTIIPIQQIRMIRRYPEED